jgi:hypothetical protein
MLGWILGSSPRLRVEGRQSLRQAWWRGWSEALRESGVLALEPGDSLLDAQAFRALR